MKKCNIQKEKYELASYTILILPQKCEDLDFN